MTTVTAHRPGVTSLIAATTLVVDLLALGLGAALTVWTWQELTYNPGADPLTGIGYVMAIGLAVPAGISLLLLAVSRRCQDGARRALVYGAAAPPALLLGLLVVGRVAA